MKVPGGCIFWTSVFLRTGYGRFWLRDKWHAAHRFALEMKLGRPIRPGFMALHKCSNRACVNMEHLYEGNASENNLDRYRAGRYKLGPEKRAALIREVESGASIPKTCAKYGVKRNWYTDHKRLVRQGRREGFYIRVRAT